MYSSSGCLKVEIIENRRKAKRLSVRNFWKYKRHKSLDSGNQQKKFISRHTVKFHNIKDRPEKF